MQGTRHDILPVRSAHKAKPKRKAEDATFSCMGKQTLGSAREANIVARNMRRFGKPTEAYRCVACGRWHVGRTNPNIKSKRK